MLQEATIKKITEIICPLVKLNIFTQEEIDELQRVNEPVNPVCRSEKELPEKIPELFTVAETAKMLKLTVKGVYDLIKAGKLDLIKLGGRTSRISGDNIREMIYNSRIRHNSILSIDEENAEK